MVLISNVDQLSATVKIGTIKYDLEATKAEVAIIYEINVAGRIVNRLISLSIHIIPSALSDMERLMDQKSTKLASALDKIKDPITHLLKLSKYVDVDADQIANKLIKEVEGT